MSKKIPDNLDVRILEILQRDVCMPVSDLAEKVSSSKSVVWRRIQQMIELGVIRERVAIVDPRSVGLNVLIFVRVKMGHQPNDTMSQFTKAVQNFPEVLECHALLGELDFLLKVIVHSLDDYEEFLNAKLSRIEGVREIVSSVSVSDVVSTTKLPLKAVISRVSS